MRSSGTGSINLFSHSCTVQRILSNCSLILALVSQASFTPWTRTALFTKFKLHAHSPSLLAKGGGGFSSSVAQSRGQSPRLVHLSPPGLSQWGESNFPKFRLSGARKREWMQNEEGHTMTNVHSRSWGTGDQKVA